MPAAPDKNITAGTGAESDPNSLNNTGVYYYSKGMFLEAIEQFKKALTISHIGL